MPAQRDSAFTPRQGLRCQTLAHFSICFRKTNKREAKLYGKPQTIDG